MQVSPGSPKAAEPQIRSTNIEIRNKSEFQNPKSETTTEVLNISDLDFEFVSDLVLRISDLKKDARMARRTHKRSP
jgi:hypothetical protein